MKKLKLFFALFAMLALGVGNAWAEESSHTIGWGAATGTNSTNFTKTDGSGEVANVVSVTTAKNSASSTPAYNSSSKELRLYYNAQGNGCSLTLTPVEGITITGVKITASSTSYTPTVKYNVDGGSDASGTWSSTTMTINGINATTSLKLRNANTANKQLRIKTIQITYTKEVATGPTLSAKPNKVEFGTKNIYLESEKEDDLEIEITGQNLTGNVTAAISGTDASVFTLSKTTFTPNSGEVSEKLSVSYSVSEVKNYTATLTLSSDGVDDIELPITLTTVNKKPTIYTKVTDAATLSAGDKVILVYESAKKAAGKISNTTGGYLNAIDITQALNTTANPATVSITDEAVVEYTLDGTAGAWELISTSGKLSEKTANATSAVDLAVNQGTKWTISIASGDATIKGTTNTIKYNTSSPRFKTYYSGQTAIQLYAISVPKYAVNFTQPEGGELIVKNGETAITSGNTFAEGIKLTVTATPANGYEGGTVVVKDADGNVVTATVYADGVLTMPAYAVTISATFEKKECTLLATPTVSATTTYNSATLSWGAVANAAKYSVKIGSTDAVETTETSYEVTGLTAETEYAYQIQAIAEVGQDIYCDSEVAEGKFTTVAAPVATLILKDIVGTTTQTGALNGTITLPTEAAECSKTFVGWDADESCNHAPTYARGAEYTLAAETQTLYAVYADEKESTTTEEYTFTSFTSTQEVTLGSTSFRVKLQKGTGSTNPAWNSGSAEARIYAKGLLTIVASKPIVKVVYTYAINKNSSGKQPTIDGVAGKNNAGTWDAATKTWNGSDTEIILSTSGDAGNVGFKKIVVTLGSIGFENYSTTCAAAPKAEVNPTTVSATAAGANGKVTVTYDNVKTENVAVALFNDAACTETFTADWLTASLDGDKNIAYTVAENTTYAERKAYIKFTAPETTGATEPAVVVIPVIQAGKDKVFASLEELVAADLTAGDEVTVTLNNDVIKEFYIYSSKRCGVVFDVQKDGKDIKIYFNNQTTIVDWAVGGKLSGTLTNVKWTTYSSAWQLAPANTWAWANLTYTEPKAVSTVVVSGAPTKTTYVDGEAFDPAGLTVTVNYNDATNEVNPTGVTFAVTPVTLVKGQTSVSVTATFNSVSSAAYEVTGLTVNDIPTKTVAEFIAAGGTRCYLEGIVSGLTEGNSMKYGNFDLTDASGKIYVYGCLNAAGESQKFADLGVKNGDKIKVIADEYELYGGTKDEAKNVQYVSHVSAASITIADITMEVGETKTIEATITPDAAQSTVQYAITSGNEYITLDGTTITANAVGTATITATIAEGATYMGNSVDFTVKVTPKTNKVVILAEREGQWYALKAEYLSGKTDRLVAVPVDYFNGTLYNVAEEVKATIEWNSIVEGDKVSFLNDGKYLKGKTSTTLIFEAGEEGLYQWDKDDYTMVIGTTERTFLYNGEAFRNFATSNAGQTKDGITYSSLPVVTAPVYVNLNTSSVKTVEKGIFSVADGKFVQFSTGNLQYEVETNKWSFAENQYDYVGEENINVGNPSYTGKIDMFGWSADGKFGVNPSNKNEDYYGTFQDWGTLVNEEDWYTLSADEWKYLLNTRANASSLKQIAKVDTILGIMLFPDAWTMPTDVNVTAEYDTYFKVNIYNYTPEQWTKLEEAGAVFLPAAGRRTGGWGNTTISPHMVGVIELDSDGHYKHYDNGNIYCYYWTSTINESKDVSYLHNIQALGGDEYTIGTGAVWGEKGRYGQSVRLVKAIEPDYKREVRQGYYGTICLENGGQMIGASLFGLSYYNEAQGLLYMDEADATMVAGNPYIFLPNEGADSLYVFYDETTATEAGTVNGLVGSFESKPLDADGTNYIMKDNKIKKVVGEYASVGANKAYIKLGSVDKNEPAPVPGRRRVAIGQAPQVATGMESVDASAQPVKMIIDGQLYILRGEKMYDAQGKLVK